MLKSNETGSVVVQAVLSKLHSPPISMCDHRLLRRIALVETDNGTTGVPDGGTWALDEKKFNVVASDVVGVFSNKLCLDLHDTIPYELLRQPLVSGLAASLYLYNVENRENVSIPLAENIEEQAQFWIKHYHSGRLMADCFV